MSRYDTALWAELVSIQNDPANDNRDILTITGFMDDEQFEQHVIDNRG